MNLAYFDAAGICVFVGDIKMRKRPNGPIAEVIQGTRPDEIWWDGEVKQSVPATLPVPEKLTVGETFEADLPAGSVAIVNGKRQTGRLTLEADGVGDIHVEIRGSIRGSYVVLTVSYVELRKAEYPPMTDFVDAWVKGDESALERYRKACLDVKAKFPKEPS